MMSTYPNLLCSVFVCNTCASSFQIHVSIPHRVLAYFSSKDFEICFTGLHSIGGVFGMGGVLQLVLCFVKTKNCKSAC